MTDYTYRITAVCPVAARPVLDAIAVALGYSNGGSIFRVPLYSFDSVEPTHYASSTVAHEDFRDLLTDSAKQEVVIAATNWAAVGLTEEAARTVLRAQRDSDPAAMMIGPESEGAGRTQLAALMAAHGLSRDAPQLEESEEGL